MSKRSVAVLTRKLREREAGFENAVRSGLADDLIAVERQIRRSPVAVPERLMEMMGEMAIEAFAQGAFLLIDFTEEVRTSVERDVRAVAANSGQSVDDALAQWEPIGWMHGALEAWEEWVTGAVRRSGVEIQRQIRLARVYDENDFEESVMLRLFSMTPVRRQGRRGIGLFPSLVNVLVGGITNPAYGMVNAQRGSLFRELAVG